MEARISRSLKRLIRVSLFASVLYGSYKAGVLYLTSANQQAIAAVQPVATDLHPGDLLFLQFACSRLPSHAEIASCYTEKAYRRLAFAFGAAERYRLGEWESVAIVVQGHKELRVVGFLNDAYCNYAAATFPAMPFVQQVAVRRLSTLQARLDQRSWYFLEAVDGLHRSLKDRWSVRSPLVFRDSVDVVLNFWVHAGLSDVSHLQLMLKITVQDLLSAHLRYLGASVGQYSALQSLGPFPHHFNPLT